MQKRNLLLTLGLVLSMSMSAQTSPYAGNEVADGDFFIYNVETGLWLQNNEKNTGDWNTRGATGTYGFDFGVKAETGGWRLDPKFGHNHSMNASNFYLDTGDGLTVWTIEPKTVDGVTNAYTIKSGDQVLGLDENDNLAWTTDKSTWQFVTREDRVNYLTANATEANPIDATFFIQDPSFANENDRRSAWQWNRTGGNLDDVRWYWNRRSYAVWNTSNFTLKQTITNLPIGTYKMTFKGFYRDGNRDEVAERRTAGTERLLAKYFINNDKADVMSILDGASETWVEGLFYYPAADAEAPYGHYPDNANGFNRIFQDYPNAYLNKGVTSVVTNGTITLGLEKLEANASDWLSFDDFRLEYLGSEGLDLSTFIDGLQATIDEAEAFDVTTTSDVMAEELKAAIAEAKEALTLTNPNEIAAASTALSAVLSTVKSVNVVVLRQTIPLAKDEKIATEVAEDVVVNAKDQASVDQALYDLRAARKIKAQSLKDIYTGSKPAAGKVYIFNVGTGLFLGTGSDWNTHAAVDQAGIEVELIDLDPAEENNFRIKTDRGGGWLNYGGYVDTSYDDIWHFVPVEGKEGVYNISSTGNDGNLLGYDPNGATTGEKYWSTVAIDRTGLDNPMNQWKVITPAEREALLAKANAAAPVEVSYLIKNASLNRQDGYDMWTKECEGGNGGARVSTITNNNGDRAENYGYEYFEPENFSFTQNLEGLKPGVYEVSVNGFFRNGNGRAQAEAYNNGKEPVQLAYLFANDAKALLPNITSVMSKVPGATEMQLCNDGEFPNMPQSSLEYFEYGYYKCSVEVLVGEDGKLTLGVKKDERQQMGDWTMFDNFRLVYKGQPTEAVTLPKTWNFSNWEAGTIYPSIEVDGLTAVVNNPENTIDIDAHARSVDGVDYTQRLKLGGTGSENNRVLTFLAPGNFNIEVVLTSASTSRERTLNIATGEFSNVVATMTAAAGEVTKEMSSVQAELEEPVYIYSEKDGINLYAIYLKPYDETVTGITEVAAERMDGNVYNLQGQKVVATKKGLYIVDGKKVIMK